MSREVRDDGLRDREPNPTSARPAVVPPWRGRVDGVLMAALWVLATGLNLWLARASTAGGV